MRMNKWSAVFILTLTASATGAQSYQAEVDAGYMRSSSDNFPFDLDTMAISGRWYFNAVDAHNHPLAEAAFLARASGVSLTYADYDSLVGIVSGDETNAIRQVKGSWKVLAAEVNYYVPNTHLYIEAGYFVSEQSVPGYDSGSRTNSWGAALGLAPADGLLILTRYTDDSGYRFNIESQYVAKLSGENAVRIEASFYDGEQEDYVSIGADYYFDRTWSVGSWVNASADAGLRINTSDNGFGLRTRKFIGEVFSVSVDAYKFDSLYQYGLDFSLRF